MKKTIHRDRSLLDLISTKDEYRYTTLISLIKAKITDLNMFTDTNVRNIFKVLYSGNYSSYPVNVLIDKGLELDTDLTTYYINKAKLNFEEEAKALIFEIKQQYELEKAKDIAVRFLNLKDQTPEETDEFINYISNISNELLDDGEEDLSNCHSWSFVMPYIEQAQDGTLDKGISTGFSDIDNLGLKLTKGSLYVIAAPAKTGKSTFMLQMAHKISKDRKCFLIQLEMTKKQVQEKLIGMALGCNPRYAIDRINNSEAIEIVSEYLSNTQLEILRPNGARADINILLYYMRKKAKEGVEVFFIDQLSFIKYPDSKIPYHLQVDEIVRLIKAEAISLNVIVVLAHQLIQETTRSGKTNFDLSDLKSSSGVGETLDDAIFLRKDEETNNVSIMWRGRNGSGETEMIYNKTLAIFLKTHYELK